ncbi:L,D-transpeptidase family protein [Streptomyces sp. MAA16]|uniref:L,D-transpeptidase family protein n=1 Tax=Streptomyces TaxID=1883 RepID=UPI002476A716|nr:L,D-transpeptidase family protein [Streptomyces sp. MAA16]MDH6697909.1 L,D-peptidoglycan transpeptidase YkuD (ErfK/YbiS/YcfS/YnhG family) [Streptomyces sp. MAA16]
MITRRTRAVLLAASLVALTGCGAGTASDDRAAATAPAGPSATPVPRTSVQAAPLRIPGLGPRTRAGIPKDSEQAVVVTGEGRNSPDSRVTLYARTERGWEPGAVWPAHNALKGWTDHHRGGDLRSPIGVFGLTDAGGLRPDPGTRLPYDHGSGFTSPGTGFEGEPLAGSFDYVVAINYNRRPGTTPLDWTRPLGADRGGGIWIHVDHGGPTHGCVSVSETHMKRLLRTLDPALHPVVVMGDAVSLAR